MELAEVGELFDNIIEQTKLNEAEAKLHFFQIAPAMKIGHRDLKPDNKQLCLWDKFLPILKILDVGLSKLLEKTRLSQRSLAMPLRGFEPLSVQTQVSCLRCPNSRWVSLMCPHRHQVRAPFGKFRTKRTGRNKRRVLFSHCCDFFSFVQM